MSKIAGFCRSVVTRRIVYDIKHKRQNHLLTNRSVFKARLGVIASPCKLHGSPEKNADATSESPDIPQNLLIFDDLSVIWIRQKNFQKFGVYGDQCTAQYDLKDNKAQTLFLIEHYKGVEKPYFYIKIFENEANTERATPFVRMYPRKNVAETLIIAWQKLLSVVEIVKGVKLTYTVKDVETRETAVLVVGGGDVTWTNTAQRIKDGRKVWNHKHRLAYDGQILMKIKSPIGTQCKPSVAFFNDIINQSIHKEGENNKTS